MAHHKLILEDHLDETFALIAIHSAVEEYKMAFLCNRHLGLRLKRSRADLDFSSNGLVVTFPWFEYENPSTFVSYDLVRNNCKTDKARTFASDGLFGKLPRDQVTSFLVPELKRVDYLLKVQAEGTTHPFRGLLPALKRIPEIASAYEVDPGTLKSRNNLIFD